MFSSPGFFKMPRTDRNLRTLMGDLHRLIGLWSIWFFAIISLTSVYYFFEWDMVDWNSKPPQLLRKMRRRELVRSRSRSGRNWHGSQAGVQYHCDLSALHRDRSSHCAGIAPSSIQSMNAPAEATTLPPWST